MTIRVISFGFVLFAVAHAALAQPTPPLAQPAPPPAQHQPPAITEDPKACAPGERAQPNRPPGATTGENLGDKLARTDGVICPPNVDPKINAPTPDVGKMPIIPPPGTPGGNPDIRPK